MPGRLSWLCGSFPTVPDLPYKSGRQFFHYARSSRRLWDDIFNIGSYGPSVRWDLSTVDIRRDQLSRHGSDPRIRSKTRANDIDRIKEYLGPSATTSSRTRQQSSTRKTTSRRR